MRVDFFVAGVQKGGTTALDALLRKQPGIAMARVKEPHFFDDDRRDWNNPRYADLHELFEDVDGRVTGESTPVYSYWPGAVERMARYNPQARIILCLRHPAFRAHSAWRMEVSRGTEALAFADAIRDDGRLRVRSSENGVHRIYSYVERGFYSPQILRVFSSFSRQRVLFVRTDDLWSNTRAAVACVCAFLVTPFDARGVFREYTVSIESGHLPAMSCEDRAYLDALYRSDIERTAELTGLDLSDWLSDRYQEPMTGSRRSI